MPSSSRRRLLQGGVALAGLGLLSGCEAMRPRFGPAKVPRIAYVGAGDIDPRNAEAVAGGLRELGYVEGHNLAVEWRPTGGRRERAVEIVADVVARGVDAIVVTGVSTALVAQEATRTIPLIFVLISDPLENGLVTSLARPGGNSTGLGSFQLELSGRQLQLLRETLPSLARVGVLWQGSHPGKARQFEEIRSAAPALGIQVESLAFSDPRGLAGAVQAGGQARVEALFTLHSDLTVAQRARIVELTAQARLPAIYEIRDWTDVGGLLSYGPSFSAMHHRAAAFVDKILKGIPPGDLPVERPTTFELVVNLKTAQAMGLSIPPLVLQQATELIQ